MSSPKSSSRPTSLSIPVPQLLLISALFLIAVGIVPFKQVIANAVILSTADGDCDKPIYDWISVVIALYATKVVLLGTLAGLVFVQRKFTIANSLVMVLFIIAEVAVIAWSIVGSVWMDESSDCENSNPQPDYIEAFHMTLATVIISYIVTGTILICSACAGCCIYIGGRLMAQDKLGNS